MGDGPKPLRLTCRMSLLSARFISLDSTFKVYVAITAGVVDTDGKFIAGGKVAAGVTAINVNLKKGVTTSVVVNNLTTGR